jgi:hypothetical protein
METVEMENPPLMGHPEEKTEREGMPDSVAEFIDRFELPDKFRIILKRTGGGEKGIIREYKSEDDDIDQAEFDVVGREFGPAKYQWNISWYDPELKKSPMRSFTRELTSDVYLDAYQTNQESKQRLKDARSGSSKSLSETDVMLKANEMADKQFTNAMKLSRELSAPMQQDFTPMLQMMQNSQQTMMQMQMQARQDTMNMFTGLATALVPVLTKLLEPKPQPQLVGNDPMGMFDKALSTVASMIDMKQALKGEEPPSLVDKIAGLVENNLPTILSVVEMSKQERQKTMAYQMMQNSSEVKQLEANPEMKAQAIEKVAEKIGLDDTRKVIEALEWDEFLPQIDEAIGQKNQMVAEAGLDEVPQAQNPSQPFDEDEEVEPTFQ